MLLNYWFSQHYFRKGCKFTGLNNFSKAEATTNTTDINVVKTIGFTTFPPTNGARTIGFTTFPKTMLLKPTCLQQFQNIMWPKTLLSTFQKTDKQMTVDISENNVAETNGFSGIAFVNVVNPLVLATLFSEMLQNQRR